MVDIYKQVSSRIEADFYPYHRGEWFTQDDVCRQFDWRESASKQSVSKKLYHDYKEKAVPTLEKQGKAYRIIEYEADNIDWQSADHTKTIDIILPFGLHNFVKIFPKNLIVVAGSSNAGKTAYLYNFVVMNMLKHKITLYNSEVSAEQMKERFLHFEDKIPNPAPFDTRERYDNYADIIDPDGISVIDYLDYDSEVYQVGIELSKIFRKLKKGLAIVAIQKKRDAKNYKGQDIKYKLGYGSDMTLKKASLYLALDPGKLEIVKAKSWKNPDVNPNDMRFSFNLIKGCKFVNIMKEERD